MVDVSDFPVTDNLNEVLSLMKHFGDLGEFDEKLLRKKMNYSTKKEFSSLLNDLRILGLVDNLDLTPMGWTFSTIPNRIQQFRRLSIAFRRSNVFQSISRYYDNCDYADLDAARIAEWFGKEGALNNQLTDLHQQTISNWVDLLGHYSDITEYHIDGKTNSKRTVPEIKTSFNSGEAGKILSPLGQDASVIRVATAYFTFSGYRILMRKTRDVSIRILVGTEEATENIGSVISRFKADLESNLPSNQGGKEYIQLRNDLLGGRVVFRRRVSPRFLAGVHAKLYIFDSQSAYVTSSNLTYGGFVKNIETGHLVVDQDRVNYLLEQFDQFFDEGENISPLLIPLLEERIQALGQLVSPYVLYRRTIWELWGKYLANGNKLGYDLADFQRMIVGGILKSQEQYRGTFLICPTGTGKTVMSAYVADALLTQGVINTVVVICPKTMVRSWKDTLDHFGIISRKVISEGMLRKDQLRDYHQTFVENISSKVLVIVDESHYFKNPGKNRTENLKSFLRLNDVNPARRLLLTATPIGKGWIDLENQFLFVGDGASMESRDHLEKDPRVVHVNLPFLNNQFGLDGSHIGYALKYGEEVKYFPRKNITTIEYDSGYSHVFEMIRDLDLSVKTDQQTLEGKFVTKNPYQLLRIGLARKAESSPSALEGFSNTILSNIQEGKYEYTFNDQDKLVEDLKCLSHISSMIKEDLKISQLYECVEKFEQNEKILIFSESVATVKYLKRKLKSLFPKRRIESATGDDNVDALLNRFVPQSQKMGDRMKGNIDILIASDKLAEGRDMQQCKILINYDLYWTPHKIIQRVGRIDRPDRMERDVWIYNFYPGARIYHQILNHIKNLEHRSEIVTRLTGEEILGTEEDIEDADLVRIHLFENEDYDQMVEAYLPSSAHLRAMVDATKYSDLDSIKNIPTPLRSTLSKGSRGTFLLVEYDGNLIVIIEDDGNLKHAPVSLFTGTESPQQVVEKIRLEQPIDDWIKEPPEGFDLRWKKVLLKWAGEVGVNPRLLKPICVEELN